MAIDMSAYVHTSIIKTDKSMENNGYWGGGRYEIGVGQYKNPPVENKGSAYVVIVDRHHNQHFISPEAALEMAFALFDIVEKVKPSLIQNVDGPKA